MSASPGLAVIKREFLSGLRSPRPFFFLAMLLLVMIGGLVLFFIVDLEEIFQYAGAINSTKVRELFTTFSCGLYFSAILLVPPMAAVSICVEKQQDSYDLLRMTYISPFSLALAKLCNVLGLYTLIALATLPLAGVSFFLVGIDWVQFAQSSIIIAFSALSCAIVGVACSAKFYRTLPAIMTTYLIGAILQGVGIFAVAILIEWLYRDTWISNQFNLYDEEILAVFSPLGALIVVGDESLPWIVMLIMAAFNGGILFLGFLVTLYYLRHATEPMKVDQEKPIDDQLHLETRRKNFPFYLIDPRRRRPAIPDTANPVYCKELQTGLLGNGSFGVRIFYGFTLFSLLASSLTGFFASLDYESSSYLVSWGLLVQTVIILVLTPSLMAMALSKEHESGNLDMLRMTLLSPWQIIQGKFRTGLYAAVIPVCAAITGSLPLALFGWGAVAALCVGLASLAVCVFYTLAVTLLATTTCKRGISSLTLGYSASVGALVLPPVLLLIIYMLFDTFIERIPSNLMPDKRFFLFPSPLTAQYANMEWGYYEDVGTLNRYWLVNSLIFAGIPLALTGLAGLRFTRYLERGAG